MHWLTLPLLGFALAQTQPVQTQPAQTPPLQTQPTQSSPAQNPSPAPDSAPPIDAAAGSSVSLTRTAKDGSKRLITVLRTGTSDETGIFTACQPLEDDPPGTPTISVFSETGAGGIRVTIDKNVIVAPLAVVSQKEGGDGHIEVSAGTARYLDAAAVTPVTGPMTVAPASASSTSVKSSPSTPNPTPTATPVKPAAATPSPATPASSTPAGVAPNPAPPATPAPVIPASVTPTPAASPVTASTPNTVPVPAATPALVNSPTSDRLTRCEVEAKASTVPDSVNVTQGKTRLKGSKLVYDDSDGIARIDGPITFARDSASGDSASNPLTGSSASIEVNVDEQTTTLVGAVTLKNGARTSSAERVEYDDAANVAILRGTAESPAKTVTADQTLTASVIRYNLDTGSVVAIGPVGGEFQDGQTPGTQTPGTASPLPANPGDTAPTPVNPGGPPRPPGGS